MSHEPEMITASELREWVYSREEWRKRRLGQSAPDQARLEAGNQVHARKEAAQRGGSLMVGVGSVLIVLAVVAALLWR